MFDGILQRFAERTPASVMVRGLLERLLNAERLDRWFEATRDEQYTRQILFSSLVGLMLQIVCRVQANVHAAYRESNIAATVVAVYGKLQGVELSTSQGLVRLIAGDAAEIIDELGGTRPERLPGYRILYLDGNCIAASERRLKPLRDSAAAPLPGKALVVFDDARGLLSDVFPCADGHAQERSLLGEVAETVQANDLWIADRNFCVTAFMAAIARRQAAFVIRHHTGLSVKPLSALQPLGRSADGELFEQAVQVTDAEGHTWTWRRVVLRLKQPTRDGHRDLILLTNLPAEQADAATVAERYRGRWTIETAFQKLEGHLNSELNTLGYPQAALFGFCLALVAFNLYAVVMAALRAAHPEAKIDETVSEYYLAAEIARTSEGLNIAVEEQHWSVFSQVDQVRFCAMLLVLAQNVDLKKLRKTTRGPKKPRTPRTKHTGKPHVSTAKLLAQAAASSGGSP
ncbi:MAG: transposase [Lamprobacter sp.]|uniref:transposase n=1 Tax=Lamprobacter sp. TaxID=3100796 RepID=UPI002B25B978|nr:transposase [Lamprobacter sp.]MEA3640778.1 transposase [Lamprobacter sp.]